jgi:hypothetical protein
MQKQIQIQKQQEYLEEVEEELSELEKLKKRKEFLKKLGIVITLSYHCKRCNHVWFPKDFDVSFENELVTGEDILKVFPPKSCARCKSKYWNLEPKRKTGHTTNRIGKLSEKALKNRELLRTISPDKMNIFGHDMLTVTRINSTKRRYKKKLDAINSIRRVIEEMEQFGVDEKVLDKFKKYLKYLEPKEHMMILKQFGVILEKL